MNFRRFQFRYLLIFMLPMYLLLCQSCMTMRLSASETTAYFQEENVPFISRTPLVGEHRVHYVQTGNPSRPTLFFIHGSPGSWDAYKRYLSDSLLLEKYRMIAVDRPGFGYSDFGHAEDLPEQAQILEDFLAQSDNGQPVVLIGHSLGGPLALWMAADHPDRFSDVVILAGAVDPRAETPELWRRIFLTKPLRYLIPGALRPSNDELWWLKKDLLDLEPKLQKIRSKVTILHGTKDRLVPYSNLRFTQKALTHARSVACHILENGDHFIPWSHYEQVRSTLVQLIP